MIGEVKARWKDDIFFETNGKISPLNETILQPCVVDDRDGPVTSFCRLVSRDATESGRRDQRGHT
jgi:hypothetical protein